MASEKEIKKFIINFIERRAERLGIREKFLMSDFELLKTGLLDSISFIDLIVALENEFNIEFDFENKSPAEYSKLSGLTKLVEHSKKKQ